MKITTLRHPQFGKINSKKGFKRCVLIYDVYLEKLCKKKLIYGSN